MLQIYTKSGHGKTLDGSAYSDSQKNTKAVASPSLTILAESVPGRFYELVDEAMIASGLLPRFLVFEYRGKRQYDNAHKGKPIPDWLATAFGALCEQSLNITSRFLVGGAPYQVPFSAEAEAAFAAYDTEVTDRMNADPSEVVKQLWNRAHEKALKLAGIVAVGINPFFPAIDLDCFMWATRIVNRQTLALLAKFEAGEVGKFASEEEEQVAEVIKAITLYLNCELAKVKSYGVDDRMHDSKVFTKSFLYRYLSKRAVFRNDRQGANNALARALKTLEEGDEIREVGKPQMNQSFGAGPRAYCVANPARFLSYHRV